MEGSLEEKQTQCIKGWATCKLQEVNWRRCLGWGGGLVKRTECLVFWVKMEGILF